MNFLLSSRSLTILGLLLLCSVRVVSADEPIEVESVMIRIVKQIEVPAREPGVLTQLLVREGEMVELGQKIAQIEDVAARLEVEGVLKKLQLNRQKNENDVPIRMAVKSHEVAQAEWRRAKESESKYQGSVSQSEMDFLQLAVEKTKLEIEKEKQELELARAAIALNENELKVARMKVARRAIFAPLGAQVVQVDREQGEWVRPGETVLQLLRLDQLRAEGFIPARLAAADLVGRKVTVRMSQDRGKVSMFSGKITFVHPKIDPVNREVRIWAEVENENLALRPGMRGQMTIHSEKQ